MPTTTPDPVPALAAGHGEQGAQIDSPSPQREPRARAAVVLSGNPVDGLMLHGPFDDHDAALAWGDRALNFQWWTADLHQPEGLACGCTCGRCHPDCATRLLDACCGACIEQAASAAPAGAGSPVRPRWPISPEENPMTQTTTPAASGEVFVFEQAENLRHYRVLTLTLDADQGAEVRALIAADDHEGLRRFLDDHRDGTDERDTCLPVDLDYDDPVRDPNLLSIWTRPGGVRDVLWEP